MKTLLIAAGVPILNNRILSLEIVDTLRHSLDGQQVEILEDSASCGDVLDVIDKLSRYDRVVLVASETREGKHSGVHRFHTKNIDEAVSALVPFDTSVGAALKLGQTLGTTLPQDFVIFALALNVLTSLDGSKAKLRPTLQAVADVVAREVQYQNYGNDYPYLASVTIHA